MQVLSFGRQPRALYLMSVNGGGGGAAAWQPHAVTAVGANGGAAAESHTMPPRGAVPILAAVFDAAVHIRTLGSRNKCAVFQFDGVFRVWHAIPNKDWRCQLPMLEPSCDELICCGSASAQHACASGFHSLLLHSTSEVQAPTAQTRRLMCCSARTTAAWPPTQ